MEKGGGEDAAEKRESETERKALRFFSIAFSASRSAEQNVLIEPFFIVYDRIEDEEIEYRQIRSKMGLQMRRSEGKDVGLFFSFCPFGQRLTVMLMRRGNCHPLARFPSRPQLKREGDVRERPKGKGGSRSGGASLTFCFVFFSELRGFLSLSSARLKSESEKKKQRVQASSDRPKNKELTNSTFFQLIRLFFLQSFLKTPRKQYGADR